MFRPEESYKEIRDFLEEILVLSNKAVVTKHSIIDFRFETYYYRCYAKEEDSYLEIRFRRFSFGIHYILDSKSSIRRYISFSEFFDLLDPEIKKHFVYHLDLFREL